MKGQNEMSVNEIDLMRQLGDVDRLPNETFDLARTVLQAAIALEDAPRVIEMRASNQRRRSFVSREA